MANDLFAQRLLALSDEKRDFDIARHEWTLRLLLEGEPHECLCGRVARDEVCLFVHRRTRAAAKLGACCAERRMGYPAKLVFAAWTRVALDPRKSFNEAFVDFAFGTGIFTEWERDFYRDTWRKRTLSLEQERKRRQINWKAIREVRARRGDATTSRG